MSERERTSTARCRGGIETVLWNALGRRMHTKLKCYSGDTPPQSAQQTIAWNF